MELIFHDTAVGPCIQCGKESLGSMYWLSMTDEMWDVLRPIITHLFPVSPYSNVRLVTKGRWFFENMDRPFCGPQCSLNHKEEDDGEEA